MSGGQGGDAPVSSIAASNISNLLFNSSSGGGGGGGGYYYGGGGGSPNQQGSAGSGGGGSSYIDFSQVMAASESAGAPARDAVVVPVYDTAITITNSPEPSFVGTPVTITTRVTVAGSNQPVTGGTVGIYVDNYLTKVPVGADGVATLTVATLYTGSHLQALFFDTTTPTAAYHESLSNPIYPVVHPCAPAPSIIGQPGGFTAVYGTNVTFHASVSVSSGYGGVPQVQFQTSTDGGTTWTNAPGTVSITDSGTGTADAQLSFNASVRPGYLEYRAVATTCGGTATSMPARVLVLGIAFNLSTLPAKTYGDAPFDISSYASASSLPVGFTSATSSVCTVAGGIVTLVGAGTCTINAVQGKDYSYFDQSGSLVKMVAGTAPPVQQSFTVSRKALTVVPVSSPPSQSYGTATAPTVTCTAGFVGTDTFVTPPVAGVYLAVYRLGDLAGYRLISVGASTPARTYITRCTGGTVNSNYYTINGYTDGTFTITPAVSKANQTITFGAIATKTYGDADFDPGATASSNLTVSYSVGSTDNCTIVSGKVHLTGAGSCTVTASQSGNTTYNAAPNVSQTFNIAKATLTIIPTHDAITYGDPAPTSGWGYTASGFVASDNASNTTITGNPSGCTTAYVQGNPPGSSYAINCTDTSGMFAANYTFTPANGALTVATRVITVTAADAGYTYGNTPPSSYTASVTAGSLAGTDTLSGLDVTCSPVDSSNVPFTPTATTAAGQYSIVCSGGTTTNYSYTYGSGTLTVAPRPITVTAGSPASQIYGNTSTPTVNCTSSGFLTGDGFSTNPTSAVYDQAGTTQVTISSTSNAGSYTTECGGGTVSSNYTIQSDVPGTFTINPASLTITASDGSITYGGTVPPITPSYSAFANGDSAASLTTAPTCSTVATSGSGVGQYASSCSGAAGSNYTISYKNGSVTVNPSALAVTAPSPTMTYGDTTLPGLSPTSINGLGSGDTFISIGGSCSALTNGSTPTAFTVSSSTPAGTYTVRCLGVTSGNYTVTYTDGTLTVNKSSLSVTAPSTTMTYGDTTLPSLAPSTVNGLKNNDTFSNLGGVCSLLNGSGATFAFSSSTNAGTYTVRCSGVDTTNYTVKYTDGSLTVNKAPLTVTAGTKGPVQYSDPMPALTATISGFVNGQTLATSGVTGSPSCSTTAGSTTVTAGQGAYAITCTSGTLAASNYTFPAANVVNGSLTVTQETAAIAYTGGSAVALPSSGSATITLSATVWDSAASHYPGWGATDPDGLTSDIPGDVTKMQVQWEIWPSSSCLTGTPQIIGPVAVTATSTLGVGIATASFVQSTEGSYCVVAQVVGSMQNSINAYYTANNAQVTGIAFYTNTGQFATGGGWITDTNSSNGQGGLSFHARYTKAGGAKGQMAYSWQGMYNGKLANFSITSNAISTLTFSGSTSPITATLQGKCAESIVSVATGQQLYSQGNLTFIATAKDGDYGLNQNVPSDGFSLSVFNSSNQTIKQVTATPLGGGNLIVHNG